MKPFRIVLLAGGIATAIGVSKGSDGPQAREASALEPFAALVKELDARRRVNVLHPNAQSLFDGMQVGFVNVAAGNLTFRRRDLVVRSGGAPVVFARVHDSRIRDNRDFGPRWRLSLVEEVRIEGAHAIYVDGAGVRYRFPAAGGRASPPTPRHAASELSVSADAAMLRERDGTVRAFVRHGKGAAAVYLLASVQPVRGSRIDFLYQNGLLHQVRGSNGMLFAIERHGDGLGRIASVTDAWGRSVHYSYTVEGWLKHTLDLAGNLWWHGHALDGAMTSAIGPNRKPYLRVRYGADGRVVETSSGRQYTFDYRDGLTIVKEGAGPVYEFAHNDAGATVGFNSTQGVEWSLTFDDRNRVEGVAAENRSWRYSYGPGGEVTGIEETSSAGKIRREFGYDDWGRLSTAWSSTDGAFVTVDYARRHAHLSGPEIDFGFELSEVGDVVLVVDRGALVAADYNSAGDVEAFRNAGGSVEFTRDSHGRIAAARFVDGEINRYAYDVLGNRERMEFHGGGSVKYAYDPAGNIVAVEVAETDGRVRRQKVRVGEMNLVERIEYEGMGAVDVVYDSSGKAVKLETADDEIVVVYTPLGDLARLVSTATGEVWTPDVDIRGIRGGTDDGARFDDWLGVLSRDTSGRTHAEHGVVAFDAGTFELRLGDPLELAVPGLADARRLYRTASPLLDWTDGVEVRDFRKPSNPVFQPPEYRSTNCCVACPMCIEVCVDTAVGAPPGTSPQVCFCAPVGGGGGGGGGGGNADPQPVPLPEVRRVEEISGGAPGEWVVGTVVDPGYNVDGLECVSRDGGYFIDGDILFAASTVALVATKVLPPENSSCRATNRSERNISATETHETHHLEKYKAILDEYQLGSRGPHQTSGACAQALKDLKDGLDEDFRAENTQQTCHRDAIYSDERQRENYCSGRWARERAGARIYPNC